MKRVLVLALALGLFGCSSKPASADGGYSIHAVRYAAIHGFEKGFFIEGGGTQKIDIPLVFWVLQNDDRAILVDAGYYRENWTEQWNVQEFVSPDTAIELVGLTKSDITDVIITHPHWDHMQGALLFRDATLWMQQRDFEYYTGMAWQEGGQTAGIDPRDMAELVRLNTEGKLRLVQGDNVEILPGITVYTGGRHTFESQYVKVDGDIPYVLASDNAYLYENIETATPIAAAATFSLESNREAIVRMIELAGSSDRVVPGHDPEIFSRFPSDGRVATIRR